MGRFRLENLLHSANQNRKKIAITITSLLLVAALFNQTVILGAVTAYASYEPLAKPIKDLVLILGEEGLMNSEENVQGLSGEYSGLRNTTIENRVERYANDIRDKMDNTDVKVTTVPRSESPVTVAAILKQAYFGNLDEFKNRKLVGVVIVGEVPLPVVNKNGNRFVSMYPYTDFENPIYTYNEVTNFFEFTPIGDSFEPEIWHGVIKMNSVNQETGEPFESQEVTSDYAKFFDKNHLYHEGHEDFAEFEKSIFLSEPIHEEKGYSDVLFNNYQNYLSFMDEFANNRFSTKLVPFLQQAFGLDDLDLSRNPASDYDLSDMPYLQSKSVIENSISRFAELFSTATSKERKAVLGTGRYKDSDYLSPITAISKKDEYMMQYLKLVNRMYEDKIDQIASTLSKKIPLIKGASLSGTVTFNDGTTSAIEPQIFVNNSPPGEFVDRKNDERDISTIGLFDFIFNDPEEIVATISNNPMMVNGTRWEDISSADECRIYRGGGQKTALDTTVKMARGPYDTYDEDGNPVTVCFDSSDLTRSSHQIPFDSNSQFGRKSCTQFFGQNLKDEARLTEATNIQKGQVTHEACNAMRPLANYRQILNVGGVDTVSPLTNEERYRLADTPLKTNQVSLLVEDYGNLPLTEVLPHLQGYNGDTEDWNAWSSYLLANPVKTRFVAEGSMGIGGAITKIDLNVTPINKVKEIPSLITHKDPTPEIVRKALSGVNPKVLPVDAIRYATFVDKNGEKQEVIYPNIFKATSLTDFRRQLRELEVLFNGLAGGTTYDGSLLPLIEGNQNRLSSGGSVMTQASAASVNEFISWRNYGINQKYNDIYTDFLNDGHSVSMLNLPTSFEAGVITAEVENDGLDLTIFHGEESALTRFTGARAATDDEDEISQLFKTQERERTNEAQSVSGRKSEGIPFLQWFTDYIPQWIRDNSNLGGEDVGGFAESLPGYDEIIGSSNSQIASVEIVAPADNLTLEYKKNHYFTITLKDSNGRTIVGKNESATITLTGATLESGIDDDRSKAGTQIFMVDGTQKVPFVKTSAGDVKLEVKIADVTSSKTITVHDRLIPQVVLSAESVEAGSSSGLDFAVSLKTASGREVVAEQPKVYLDGAQYGEISYLRQDGPKYFYNFTPSTNAGLVNININLVGDTPNVASVNVTPSTPERLRFTESKTAAEVNAETDFSATLELIDRYGNKANTNLTGVRLVNSSPDMLQLSSDTVNLTNGSAPVNFRITPNAVGSAYLTASKAGLAQAIHKVDFSNLLNLSEFSNFASPTLYQELRLRGVNPEPIGSSMLPNGKVESISTFTTDIAGLRPSLFVHPTGAFEVVGGSKITSALNISEDSILVQINDNKGARITGVRINPSGLANISVTSPRADTPGVYITAQGDSEARLSQNTLSINGTEAIKFNNNSVPVLLDQSFTLEPLNGTQFYTLLLAQGAQPVAYISYNFESSGAVAVVPNSLNTNYIYDRTNTLSTTNAPLGFAFYNRTEKLNATQLPESSDVRFEDSFETPFVSFGEGNKSMLLFAAGVAVGEANRPYLSEAGIVLGDPTISIEPAEDQNLGTYIGRGDTEFTSVLERENDVLFADQDGFISKFDKDTKQFQKNLIKVPNGIKQLQKFDSGQVLILAQTACTNSDSCVYLLNTSSSSGAEIAPVELSEISKIKLIQTADFNKDGDLDLITLAEDNNIAIHWNQNGSINPAGSTIGTTDLTLDTPDSLINSVWITKPASIPSATEPRPYSTSINWNASSGTEASAIPVYEVAGNDYIPVQDHQGLTATIRMSDKNGAQLRTGDLVTYTVTLTSTGSTLSNANLSLPISGGYEIIDNTLSPSTLTFTDTGEPDRPKIIGGINLENGQTLRINFDARFTLRPAGAPILSIVTDEHAAVADGIPDIKIITQGQDYIVYYHSNYDRAQNRISFSRYTFQEQKADLSVINDALGLGDRMPANISEQRDLAAGLSGSTYLADDDNDGYPNAYDSLMGGLNDAATSIEDAISGFSCSGAGCLAVPYNYAFLVPGNNPTGLEMPVFSWGCPAPGFVWPPMPWQGCAGGRIYVSPTLTGEIAGAVCLGPFRLGACWATRIADLGGLCDIINSGIQDLMTAATSFVEDSTGGIVNVGGGGGGGGGSNNITVPGFPKVLTDWLRNQIEEILNKLMDLPDLTIIYPEPQSLLGYFKSTEQESKFDDIDYLGIEDVLADISAMPLFNIEVEKHTLDYPVPPSPEAFTEFVADSQAIWEENKNEVLGTLNKWQCYGRDFTTYKDFDLSLKAGTLSAKITNAVGSDPDKQGCITLAAKFLELNNAFYLNLSTLSDYRDLPRDLFEVQNFLSDYANQVIGYAEVILDRTAGFLVDNTDSLVEWQNMFITIQNLVDEFKVVIDFISNFMASCDDCRTSRTDGGTVQTLLNLFLSIPPSIPVIEFPKLPNITLDVSQIEAGIDIKLPGIDFRPVPIALPDLQELVIKLPDAPPINLSADLGKYGLKVIPTFPPAPDIKGLIIDLPDLPELNIPKLPVIPKPPDLESIGLDFFKQIEVPLDVIGTILRIYCILKKGVVPLPESMLAGQIKGLTARPLDVVLPMDVGVGFRWPKVSYEYLEELRFVLETHLNFDLDALSNSVEKTVKNLNGLTSKIIVGSNNFLKDTVKNTTPSGTITLPGSNEVENLDISTELNPQSENTNLFDELSYQIDKLNQNFATISDSMPKEINLIATSEKLPPDQIKNYKPKYNQSAIPPKLQQSYERLIAYRDSVNSISSRYIASKDAINNTSEPVTIKTQTFQIAQAAPSSAPTSATVGATFSPTDGIYAYDAATKQTTKLIAYNAEADKKTTLMPGDFDSDGDRDLLYTLGTELFFKQNHTHRSSSVRGNGSVDTTSWSVLTDQLPSSDTLLTGSLNVVVENKQAVFELSDKLTDQVIVIDMYEANTNSPVKDKRYVYTLGPDSTLEWEDQNSVRLNGQTIKKDGFKNLLLNGGANTFRIPLENKPYQLVSYILNTETGRLEVLEGLRALTPNICGDTVPPNIVVSGGSTIVVPVLTPVEINLAQSTDSDSGIAQVYLDTNLAVDTNGDGNTSNDKNLIGPAGQETTSKFRLNPYTEVGNHQVKGWVIDAAGNASSETITIQVVAPNLSIDNVTDTSVTGSVAPSVEGIPVDIVRDRNGVVEVIGQDTTDSNGGFGIDNLQNSNLLYVKEGDGTNLFEVNEQTGSVRALKANANIEVERDTGRILLKKGNDITTTITKKSNRNLDVKAVNKKLSSAELDKLAGTVVYDLNTTDNLKLVTIPGDAASFAGGLQIASSTKTLAQVGTDGQIKIMESNVEIKLERVTNTNLYQWYEVYVDGKFVFLIFVGTTKNGVQLIDTDNRVAGTQAAPSSQPSDSSSTSTSSPFADVALNDPYLDTILYLQQNGVIEGVTRDGQKFFEGQRDITRAEYAKIILKILCIEPRPAAYQAPSVFDDIPFTTGLPWFYDETKETKLQKFFTGYLGEINPDTSLPPFKPFNSITRAEAAKVILEALYQTGAIDLSKVQQSTPWYAVYMDVAKDLKPYIVDPSKAKQTFILTPDEASQPNAVLSREQFAEMAFRVLNVKNCIADSSTGQSSQSPQSSNSNSPNGSQPSAPSSISSSNTSSQPSAPSRTTPTVPNEAGIYIEDIICSTCPCRYVLIYADDLRPGDKIFAVIRSSDGRIIARSEDLIIGNE